MSEVHSIDRIKRTIESEADSVLGTEQRLRPAAFDQPAVGIVANGSDPDEVAGAILRATRAGHQVLVAYDKAHVDPEALEFAERLGATVVKPTFDRWNGEGPTELLGRTAREYGLPGIISHSELSTRVDYEASARRLQQSSSYAVEAEPEPAVSGRIGLLVGIPAYNEEATIADVVERASEHGKVLVVDDGSDDETAAEARKAGAVVVKHDSNRGYGAALKTIFEEAERANAEHLVILDADGQHDPADVPRLIETQLESNVQVVIGCRFGEGTGTELPRYRWVGLKLVNLLTNLSFGVVRGGSWVRDAQSGFRAYDRTAIESLATDETIGNHMGASTDILHHAHQRSFRMEEVGVTIDYDVENGSSQNPVEHGITLISNLLRTIEQERPLTILGVPGFVSTLIGIGLGYWTFSNFIATGDFPLGLAVSSTFFALIGVFTVFTAILLHALKQHLGGLGNGNGS